MDTKHILVVAGNPAVSSMTGWPVGFWWSELTHPYWEFTRRGHSVTIASTVGGALQADSFSDPEDAGGYSADDFVSLGFKKSPKHAALIANTPQLARLDRRDFDAIFVIGGQSPMYTMIDDDQLHQLFAWYYESGKVAAAICHGTCILLKTKLSNGKLLVERKRWTGFANSEEDFADNFVKQRVQPFRIEDEARKIDNTTFVTGPAFAPHAIRDGNLITGQQQHSGSEAALLVLDALGTSPR